MNSIISAIIANLQTLPYFNDVYGIAELIGEQYAVVASNGDGKPVLYKDPRSGVVYIRRRGGVKITPHSELTATPCDEYQRRIYPFRLVALANRKKINCGNNEALDVLANNLMATLDIELNRSQRRAMSVSEGYVEITEVITELKDLISTEKLPEKLGSDLAVIGIDFSIVLGAEQSCFANDTCFLPVPIPPSPSRVPTPFFNRATGTYAGFVAVEILNAFPLATIYYTTNGSIPSAQNGTLYSGEVIITQTGLLRAIAYQDGFLPSLVAQIAYVIDPVTLTAIPEGGQWLRGEAPPIQLVSNSETADIFTTTDGDDPTTDSTPYAPFVPQEITQYKGRAFDPPAAPSNITDELYEIKATMPTVDTDSGVFTNQRLITATNTNPLGANEYSVNGGAFVVGNSVLIEATSTVIFRTAADGVYITSDEVVREIEIQVATPTANPNGGEVTSEDPIALACATVGATIYYTTDGSTPTTSSTQYTVPFTITQSATVKAIGVKTGLTNSEIGSFDFGVVLNVQFISAQFQFRRTFNEWDTNEALPFSIGGSLIDKFGRCLVQQSSTSLVYKSVDGMQTSELATAPPEAVGNLQLSGNNNGGNCSADDEFDNIVLVYPSVSDAGSKVWLTHDFLQTFIRTNFISAFSISGTSISKNGQHIIITQLLNSEGYLFVSNDGGVTFNLRLTSTGISTQGYGKPCMSDSGEIMYAVRRNNSTDTLWKSSDFGATWAQVPITMSSSGSQFLQCDRTGLILFANTNTGVNRSLDGGLNFVNQGYAANNLSLSRDGQRLLRSTNSVDNQFYSGDGGDTWIKPITTTGTVNKIVNVGT